MNNNPDDERTVIREAIERYRAAWLASVTSEEFQQGVLPATVSEDDSPAGWRVHEQDKRVRRAEERLIEVLDSVAPAARKDQFQIYRQTVRRHGHPELDRPCLVLAVRVQ